MKEDRISQLLKEADCVPEAPDCRAKVMQRIEASAPKRSFAWAYAAAVLVALVVGSWALLPRSERGPQVAVNQEKPPTRENAALRIKPHTYIKKPGVTHKKLHSVPNQPKAIEDHIIPLPPLPKPRFAYAKPKPAELAQVAMAPKLTATFTGPSADSSPGSPGEIFQFKATYQDADAGSDKLVMAGDSFALDAVSTKLPQPSVRANSNVASDYGGRKGVPIDATRMMIAPNAESMDRSATSLGAAEALGSVGNYRLTKSRFDIKTNELELLWEGYATSDQKAFLRGFQPNTPSQLTVQNIFHIPNAFGYTPLANRTSGKNKLSAADCFADGAVLYMGGAEEKTVEVKGDANRDAVTTYRIGESYAPPDPILLAKRFAELEALSRDGSLKARQQLVSVCSSKSEKVQVRRFAYRMLSRVATSADMRRLPSSGQTDPLWACRRIAELRIASREHKDSKKALALQLAVLLRGLSALADWEDQSMKVSTDIQRGIAQQEIGFQIADQGLPSAGFPPEATDYTPEFALYRMRSEYAKVENPTTRARLIAGRFAPIIGARGVYQHEAAVALMIEEGEPALPTVLDILRQNTLTSNPPPWGPRVTRFQDCLQILAGIGGKEAEDVLRKQSESSLPYVASRAKHFLGWIEAGVKFPAQYRRLFSSPYSDD